MKERSANPGSNVETMNKEIPFNHTGLVRETMGFSKKKEKKKEKKKRRRLRPDCCYIKKIMLLIVGRLSYIALFSSALEQTHC